MFTDRFVNLSSHGYEAFLMTYHSDQLALRYELAHTWTTDVGKVDLREVITGEPLFVAESTRGKPHGIIGWAKPEILVQASLHEGKLTVKARAASSEAVHRVIKALRAKYPEADDSTNTVWVRFWTMSKDGSATDTSRRLVVPSWGEVQGNYAYSTAVALDGLVARQFDQETGGKLILWSGDPGTGKTWALRALAREWTKWADLHYVLDPEAFFGEGEYMMKVVLGDDDNNADWDPHGPSSEVRVEEDTTKWRIIVLEDTGELLGSDAKLQTGQGLSRMLNLCDGLIGQGLRVLVLITTNEDLGASHEAVIRPGRCVANIHFEPLSAAEADSWAERHEMPMPHQSQRLAELFELRAGKKVAVTHRRAGFQLPAHG